MSIDNEFKELITITPCDDVAVNNILQYVEDYDVDWEYISKYCYMSKSFIRRFREFIDWEFIGINCDEMLHIFWNLGIHKSMDPELIDDRREVLTMDYIQEFKQYINWDVVTTQVKITNDHEIIEKYKEHLNWNIISFGEALDGIMVEQYHSFIVWDQLALNEYEQEDNDNRLHSKDRVVIIEQLVRKYADQILNWEDMSYMVRRLYEYFSDKFIMEIGGNLNWEIIQRRSYGCPILKNEIVIYFYDKIPKSYDSLYKDKYKNVYDNHTKFKQEARELLMMNLNEDITNRIMEFY